MTRDLTLSRGRPHADETFPTLAALAARVVELCRDPRDLQLEPRKMRKTLAGGGSVAVQCLAALEPASGEFIGNLIVGPKPAARIGALRDAVRLAAGFADETAPRKRPTAVEAFAELIETARRTTGSLLGARLRGVVYAAQAMPGVGLVCSVDQMPVGHFNPRWLAAQDGESLTGPYPMLSPEAGEGAWNALFTLGRKAVREAMPAGSVFALVLSERAAVHARDLFLGARAA